MISSTGNYKTKYLKTRKILCQPLGVFCHNPVLSLTFLTGALESLISFHFYPPMKIKERNFKVVPSLLDAIIKESCLF